jgi:Protein of unknown function (DUF2550)
VSGVIAPLEVLGGLLVLFGLVIGGFVIRRHFLARSAATFDCSLRKNLERKPSGWMLGVARYEEDRLEWFRIFTLDPRPGRVLQRSRLDLLEWRHPSAAEIDSILPGSVIVRCRYDRDALELAMTESDYTGFSTWLESAPPGIAPFTS